MLSVGGAQRGTKSNSDPPGGVLRRGHIAVRRKWRSEGEKKRPCPRKLRLNLREPRKKSDILETTTEMEGEAVSRCTAGTQVGRERAAIA